MIRAGVGRKLLAAGSRLDSRCVTPVAQRKVRAPQGRVPGNAWGAKAHGKCHRKYTATQGLGPAR